MRVLCDWRYVVKFYVMGGMCREFYVMGGMWWEFYVMGGMW